MESYEFSSPTKVYFGNGIVKKALHKEKDIIGERTLIVTTGGSLIRSGYLEELKNYIESELYVYVDITPDPDVEEIREAIAIGKQNNITSVIGFGGGSAIDAAKATAVGVVSDVDIEEYLLEGIEPPSDTLPIIAIPTTAGTGAELTKGAIVSSRLNNIKSGIRGERITPSIAIIDPTYTFSVPLNITMETGFDVFAHAAESYCSVNANEYSRMLSEKAIAIVGESLPELFKDIDNHVAREKMSYASHIIGYNVRNVGNCLPHRMQYPLGVETHTSHGAGLIALYPAWIKYESVVNEKHVQKILDLLGCIKDEDPSVRIRDWLVKLEIDRNITELGNTLTAEELNKMVSGNLANDRLYDKEDIVRIIYEESM